MTAITFSQYVLNKISGLKFYDPRVQELAQLSQAVPLSRTMADEVKLDRLDKLKTLGIQIP